MTSESDRFAAAFHPDRLLAYPPYDREENGRELSRRMVSRLGRKQKGRVGRGEIAGADDSLAPEGGSQ
jgi:hypothetical protein